MLRSTYYPISTNTSYNPVLGKLRCEWVKPELKLCPIIIYTIHNKLGWY